MPANNDYAYRQVLGSLHRRGAVAVVKEDLHLAGCFLKGTGEEMCWLALRSKYPSEGPYGVTVTREEAGEYVNIIFDFVGVPATN